MPDYQQIIDKYYPEGTPLRDIYLRHCRQVADKALSIAASKNLPLDPAEIEAAAMLHDIGIFLCDAPGIHCHGTEPYLRHGLLGADLLRSQASQASQTSQASQQPPLRGEAEASQTSQASQQLPLRGEAEASQAWFETMARVAERHTGAGITHEDIIADDLPLPLDRNFTPESLLERLICYADKFYSKSGTMEEKPIGKVLVSMSRFGPDSYARFRALHAEFS